MTVFVDASAWIALTNRRDERHVEAASILDRLNRRSTPFITSNWTVYEALSVIKTRVGAPAAETLWERLTNSAYVRLVNVDPAMERSALDLFFAYEDKTWGVVDCASLVVMEQLRCRQAFAFDRHFVEASGQRGFEVLKAT